MDPEVLLRRHGQPNGFCLAARLGVLASSKPLTFCSLATHFTTPTLRPSFHPWPSLYLLDLSAAATLSVVSLSLYSPRHSCQPPSAHTANLPPFSTLLQTHLLSTTTRWSWVRRTCSPYARHNRPFPILPTRLPRASPYLQLVSTNPRDWLLKREPGSCQGNSLYFRSPYVSQCLQTMATFT